MAPCSNCLFTRGFQAKLVRMGQLSKEEIVTIQVLNSRGQSKAAIARQLGVDESTVRYHLQRAASGAADGRQKPFLIETLGLSEVALGWWSAEVARLPSGRSPSAVELHDHLVETRGYSGSVKSVRAFIAARVERPPQRPFRRVEVLPGTQAQVDWSEHRDVDLGTGAPQTVYVFHMKLSHSRRQVDIVSLSMDQLHWHHVHLEAFRRLGGIPAMVRIDNLKTGMAHGSGVWGTKNAAYESFANSLGFHIDPCQVRMPRAKGKVERGVRTFRTGDLRRVAPLGLDALQAWCDQQSFKRDERGRCPVTGTSVVDAWKAERASLAALPDPYPKAFDVVVPRLVHRDCTVHFENHVYSVPYRYADRQVEVRGCVGVVEFRDRSTGTLVKTWPRGTKQLQLIDPADYDGVDTDTCLAPVPLGAAGRSIVAPAPNWTEAEAVEHRSIDHYADLVAFAGGAL